jgi:hypothetical protein
MNDLTIALLSFGLPAIVSIVLFLLFGIDKKVCPTVEVKPPDGMTPVEASFILNGQIKTEDITSLFIYWANKGYLSINNICEAGTDEFELVKLKDSDAGMKPYEKLIFDELFNGKSKVALVDLKDNFYIKPGKVKAELAHMFKSPSTRLFTRAGTISTIICGLLAGLCTGVMLSVTIATSNIDLVPSVICGIVVFVITLCFCVLLRFFANKAASGKKFGFTLCIYIVALYVLAGMCGLTVAAVTSVVSAAVCGIATAFSKKHTKQGREWLGKLLGLRKFITTAPKSEIETLVKEKPSLFYDILPFACALGVTDEWVMQFERITTGKPNWYISNTYGMFNPVYFINLMNSSISNNHNGENSFGINAFAAGRGFQSGGRLNYK